MDTNLVTLKDQAPQQANGQVEAEFGCVRGFQVFSYNPCVAKPGADAT